jgi:hypothetical protein
MPTTRDTDFEEMVTVEELTAEEAEEVFDRVARSSLGISGEEFRRRWEAGEYANSDDMAVTRLYMLMPSAR